jgi:hypothetical protein
LKLCNIEKNNITIRKARKNINKEGEGDGGRKEYQSTLCIT